MLFVDTSGWAAPILRNTPNHEEMATFAQQVTRTGRSFVTTNYVLTEVVALLTSRSRLPRPRMLQFLQQIRETTHVVHIDREIDRDAWALLERIPAVTCAASIPYPAVHPLRRGL